MGARERHVARHDRHLPRRADDLVGRSRPLSRRKRLTLDAGHLVREAPTLELAVDPALRDALAGSETGLASGHMTILSCLAEHQEPPRRVD